MPTIYIPKKKTYYPKVKEVNKKDNLIHKYVYNTSTWRNLRLTYLMENPLCKVCLERGKYISATEVHHIIPISKGKDIQAKQRLGFDITNLKGLCTECHKAEHLN